MSLFCLLCGEGPSLACSPFCPSCQMCLEGQLIRPQWQQEYGFPLFSLIPWVGDEKASHRLIDLTKELRSQGFFNEMARLIVGRVPASFFEDSLLVPLPSSTGRKHSYFLARGLSAWTKQPILAEALYLSQTVRQVGKGRKERGRRTIRLESKHIEYLLSYKNVILIDDVVTSGSTLCAAQKAFPSLCQIKAITLFRRVLSTNFASS